MAPRRRGLDLRRLGWLATTAALVLTLGHGHGSPLITALVGVTGVVLVLAAVLAIRSDPRWAIACALPATYVALMVAGKDAVSAWPLLLGPPALLTVAAISARRQTEPPAAL